MKRKNDDKFLIKIVQLLKLEVMTTAGKFNLSALILLVIFVILYTTDDTICYIVSALRDAYKTTILKTNISEPYQTESTMKILIPILILAFLCFLFLTINEKAKNKMNLEEVE